MTWIQRTLNFYVKHNTIIMMHLAFLDVVYQILASKQHGGILVDPPSFCLHCCLDVEEVIRLR